jgi:hypothetical protein
MNIQTTKNRRGLIGHWKYSGSVAAGGSLKDISGGNKHGILQGNSYIDNAGLHLDGSGDYCALGSTPAAYKTLSHTISIWIKPIAITNIFPIFSFGTGNYYFGVCAPRRLIHSLMAGGVQKVSLSPAYSVALNVYQMITATSRIVSATETEIVLYVNGVEVKRQTWTGTRSTAYGNVAMIGAFIAEANGNSLYFNGTLDDVMLFDRPLQAAEIQQIYHIQKGRHL